MIRSVRLAAVPLLAVLTLGACGQGDDPTATQPAAAAGRPAAPAAPTAPAGAKAGAPGAPVAAQPAPVRPVVVPAQLKFRARTVDGAAFDGAKLGDKPTVLWFWEAWCIVCHGQAQMLNEAVGKYAGKVNFVGVGGPAADADLKAFVADTGVTFPQVADRDGKVWSAFKVKGQPSYAFVGRDGRIELSQGALSEEELDAKAGALAG